MFSEYGNFLVTLFIGFAIAAGTYWFARKSGLQPVQAALVKTLQDNAEALSDQVGLLKEEKLVLEGKVRALETKVKNLEASVLSLAFENQELHAQLGLRKPRRGQPRDVSVD